METAVKRIQKDEANLLVLIIDHLLDKSNDPLNQSNIETLLNDDRTYIFAAINDKDVIGYALAYRFPSLYSSGFLAYLYDIEILAQHRRKGAGRLLMSHLLAQLKADQVTELWLGTATDNVEAQALFMATGGIRSGETFNDFTYEIRN